MAVAFAHIVFDPMLLKNAVVHPSLMVDVFVLIVEQESESSLGTLKKLLASLSFGEFFRVL